MAWVSNPSRNMTSAQRTMTTHCTAPTRRALMKAGTSNAAWVIFMASIPLYYFLCIERGLLSSRRRRRVSRRDKWVRKKLTPGKPRELLKVAPRAADHHRVSAGINLPARKIAEVSQDRLMNQPGGTFPIRIDFRKDRDKLEPGRACGPFFRYLRHVQILPPAAAPVQMHLAFVSALDQVLKN